MWDGKNTSIPVTRVSLADFPASPGKPTVYLVGGQPLPDPLVEAYPKWARRFDQGSADIVPIAAPSAADSAAYRGLVEFLRDEYNVLGLVMLSHADTLFQHTHAMFDEIDSDAQLLGEIGVVRRAPGTLTALAPAKVAAERAYEQTFDAADPLPEALIIGGTGPARALALALSGTADAATPRRVSLTTLDGKSMTEMRQRVAELPEDQRPILRHIESQIEHDRLVTLLPPGSLVVNASGTADKDAPSPVGDAALFPENGLVWDLDAVGTSSPFLDKARKQRSARGLRLADGPLFHRLQWVAAAAAVFGGDVDAAESQRMLKQID